MQNTKTLFNPDRTHKGRILKLKRGYNPNSSSIGTEVTIFFTAFTVVSATAGAIVATVLARARDGQNQCHHPVLPEKIKLP